MTQRTGFVLHVRPDRIDDYIEAHENVWPEMLDALRSAGIRNYTIFRSGIDVFGYFEADDLGAAARYLESQEVNSRWQNAMAELLEERVHDGGLLHSNRFSASSRPRRARRCLTPSPHAGVDSMAGETLSPAQSGRRLRRVVGAVAACHVKGRS
jgi:L-rhamnose mutarotase